MMLRSPQDAHVDHLRGLIDQRSTRADIRGRFSAISEYSDTPSVYSRPFFSPRSPSDNGEQQNCPSLDSAIQSHPDRLNNYTSSMLDLDDDSRSRSLENFNIDDTSYEDEDEDNNSTARMSYFGPKMRFHSRAPWELEDDTLEEEAATENGHRPFQSVLPFRGNGAKGPISSSSSPRPSYTTSRPSGESSRSQVPPSKCSFDTINSQISYQRGTFYTLAQESISSYSLGRSTPPTQKETLRSKFSLGRLRSESSNIDLSPSSNSPGRSPLNSRFPPSRDNDPFVASAEASMHTTTSHTGKGNSFQIEDNVHPYANPNLVVDRPSPPFRAASSCQQRTYDENVTLSESYTTDSISRTGVRDITVDSALPKHRVSSIQAKNISSPVLVIGDSHQIETPLAKTRLEQNSNSVSPVNNLSGWTDPNLVPAFSLISLEQARAQRMRSATTNPTSSISSAIRLSNPSTIFPPIETEAVPGADSFHVGGLTRIRSRSISAGANKARSALQTIVGQSKPERRGSEPTIALQPSGVGHPGKTLKHKKSGFMRLFNTGKVPEKDEPKTPPPVPSLPDSHSANHVQPVVPRTSKSIHRIPVPSLSPSLLESSSAQSSNTLTSDTWKQSTKDTQPRLSINTQPPVVDIAPTTVMDNRQNQTQASPPSKWEINQPLQSAPALFSEVPALKLRPVSTLFSAHFGDHMVATESSEIVSVTSISSSPRALSLTPASVTRASHEQPAALFSLDDQASVVRSLQEELVTAKRAWQSHIWELEGQVRDLKATVEELKGSDNKDYCQSCGRGKEIAIVIPHSGSVVHRPRARTGTSSRFTNALP